MQNLIEQKGEYYKLYELGRKNTDGHRVEERPILEETLTSMADITGLSKRRGLIFQSSEIYGGLSSCWDYGPLGVELKRNIQNCWWKSMTYREEIEGLDSSILMHPNVWKASGHMDGFTDPMIDCCQCKSRFKADTLDSSGPCPKCGVKNRFTKSRDFNLMFKTQMGSVEDSSSTVYLRPETAQGIFVNFSHVQTTMRKKLPFGIAQIGKAFRNEISPGNFIFRMREFEQMEMQYFIKSTKEQETMEIWKDIRWKWHLNNGIKKESLCWHHHGKDELAHYAKSAVDIEYKFPHGQEEMEGIHSRGDFDLKQHQKYSGKNLQYVDSLDGNKKYLPYVVETSIGSDRCLLAVMCDAYRVENKGDKEKERIFMKFSTHLAPIKVAVLPLVKKDILDVPARKFFQDIRKYYKVEYDVAGSIGKRYRRQDEIGTPFCLTFDFDSLKDHAVTIRNRDDMSQIRVSIDQVQEYLKDHLIFHD